MRGHPRGAGARRRAGARQRCGVTGGEGAHLVLGDPAACPGYESGAARREEAVIAVARCVEELDSHERERVTADRRAIADQSDATSEDDLSAGRRRLHREVVALLLVAFQPVSNQGGKVRRTAHLLLASEQQRCAKLLPRRKDNRRGQLPNPR